MSWTSDFESPPSGSRPAQAESGSADGPTDPPVEAPDGPGFEVLDGPGDKAIDPSVFDGLFSDLTGSPARTNPNPEPTSEQEPDQESETDPDPEPAPDDDAAIDDEAAPNDEAVIEDEAAIDNGALVFDSHSLELEDLLAEDALVEELLSSDPPTEVAGPVATAKPKTSEPTPAEPEALPATHRREPSEQPPSFFAQALPVPPPPASSPSIVLDTTTPRLGAPQPVGGDVTPVAAPGLRSPHGVPERAPRRWVPFAFAVSIGAVLGVGGALLLTWLQSDDVIDAQPAPAVTGADADQPIVAEPIDGQTNEQPAETDPSAAPSLLNNNQLRSHGLGFEPGTVELTPAAEANLDRNVAAAQGAAPAPVVITVRTFTEATPEQNRELSKRQAAAVAEQLTSRGLPTSEVVIRGLGAAPFGPDLPVANFVVARANLGADQLQQAMADLGPFEIGIETATDELRPESLFALDRLGEAMAAHRDGSVSLAGYAYAQPSEDGNKQAATAAVAAARDYLTANHQIDPDRLVLLAPGALPFVLGPTVGGHVEVHWGAGPEVADIYGLTETPVTFAVGSDALSGAVIEQLDRLADLLIGHPITAVLSVRASSEPSEGANQRLSVGRADAINNYLVDAGVPEDRVRVFGVGDVTSLRSADAGDDLTITVVSSGR